MTYLFVGINPRWQWFNWLPPRMNVMYSAAGFWDSKQQKFTPRSYMKQSGMRWLDCGGFTLLNKHGDYPFSLSAYANLVAALRPDYYTAPDYPCEPGITRCLGLETNEARIRRTVETAVSWANDLEMMLPGSQLVPTIQGFTLDEYKYCIDLYAEAGMIRPYMAVGSTCTRSNNKEIRQLIPAVYQYAREMGVLNLHFFGLKVSGALDGLQQYIWSRDSAAVLFAVTEDAKTRWGGRWPRTQEHRREAFENFFSRVAETEVVYALGQEEICPRCHSYQIDLPSHSWPAFTCADCGHEWGDDFGEWITN